MSGWTRYTVSRREIFKGSLTALLDITYFLQCTVTRCQLLLLLWLVVLVVVWAVSYSILAHLNILWTSIFISISTFSFIRVHHPPSSSAILRPKSTCDFLRFLGPIIASKASTICWGIFVTLESLSMQNGRSWPPCPIMEHSRLRPLKGQDWLRFVQSADSFRGHLVWNKTCVIVDASTLFQYAHWKI